MTFESVCARESVYFVFGIQFGFAKLSQISIEVTFVILNVTQFYMYVISNQLKRLKFGLKGSFMFSWYMQKAKSEHGKNTEKNPNHIFRMNFVIFGSV